MVALKKPAPKVSSGKTSSKPAAKAGGKPAPKAAAAKTVKKGEKEAFEVGQTVTFIDYSDDVPDDEKVIEAGADVVIKGIEKRDGKNIYTIVAAEDSETYDTTPDDVDGLEVIGSEIKKKKAGAVAKVKEAPKPQEVKLSADLAKMIKNAGDDQVGLAVKIYDEAKRQFYLFGGVLANIYNKNLHAPEGITWIAGTKEARDAWEEFCVENFDMRPAQVRNYIDIYQTMSKINGVDAKKLAEIGYSKAIEVAKYITNDNAEELFKQAEDLPINELKSTLKTEYLDADGKTPSGRTARGSGKMAKMTFSFQLFEDGGTTVKFILEQAGKLLGTDNDSATFEHIINEWGADKLDASKLQKAQAKGKAVAKEAAKAGKTKEKVKAAA